MNRSHFVWRAVCAFALACVVTTAAAAQSGEPTPSAQPAQGGPFAGLFGGSDKDRTQALDARASLFAAYDDSVLAQVPGLATENRILFDPRYTKRGLAGGFNASLAYQVNKRWPRSQFQLSGDAAAMEFGLIRAQVASRSLWASTYRARTRLSTDLTPKTTVTVGGGTNYGPFYQYVPFLKEGNEASAVSNNYDLIISSAWVGAVDASASVTSKPSRRTTLSGNVGWRKAQDGNLQYGSFGDFEPSIARDAFPAITPEWIDTLDASASVTNNFSRRSSISVDVAWRDAQQLAGDQKGHLETRAAHGVLAHNFTRSLSAHGGFGVEDQRYSLNFSSSKVYPTVDLGLDYGDALALSKRYELSLSTNMSFVEYLDQTAFRINGGATLTRLIGRTWRASVGYSRGTAYIVGLREPVFYDAANGDIAGQVTSRLQFSAGATYSRGRLAFSGTEDSLTSRSASARLTYGISQHVGVYGQYSFFLYDIPATFAAVNLPPTARRRAASVGLTAWLPVFGAGPQGQRDSQ